MRKNGWEINEEIPPPPPPSSSQRAAAKKGKRTGRVGIGERGRVGGEGNKEGKEGEEHLLGEAVSCVVAANGTERKLL